MSSKAVYQCQCPNRPRLGEHPDKELHHKMNVFLSRLDEQQRRWYVALEAEKMGHGGATRIAQITGLNVKTVRRGQEELDNKLADRPTDRVRLPGGGRQPVEKKEPGIEQELEMLIEGQTAGDSITKRKWVRSSLRWSTKLWTGVATR